MTSGKSLVNIPKPWFPHVKRGVGGHKRSLELQDIYSFLKMENFYTVEEPAQRLPWFLEAHVLSSSPALCTWALLASC